MSYFGNLQFHEILASLRKPDASNGAKLKVGILRNITVDTFVPLLKYLLINEGFVPEVYTSGFDLIIQETMDPNSGLYKSGVDIIINFIHCPTLVPELYTDFGAFISKTPDEIKAAVLGYYEDVISNIRKHSSARIMLTNLEMVANPTLGIYESQNTSGQNSVIESINHELVKLIKKHDNIYVIDLPHVITKIGGEAIYDKKQWYMAKSPYSVAGYKLIALECLKLVRSLYGKTKKCLVVDCDNTLWGGIIGEDGLNGIQIGHSHPGNIFYDFQQQILNLYNRGIILAINSKNNYDDVMEVLNKHPDMLLREKHFAAIYANWNNKTDNMKAIAEELNIGMDSMVFIDDSEFECNLMKEILPAVTVIELPKDKALFPTTLAEDTSFESVYFSDEDKKRGELYRNNAVRKKAKSGFTDISSYYKSLEMEVDIYPVDDFSLARVAQLSQRTNQFNVTTKRYTEDEIKGMINAGKNSVSCLKVSDKYGDIGMVGAAIIEYKKDEASIDTLLMSCRIIGRGIEEVFLKAILNKAYANGFRKITSTYIKTNKNQVVEDFFEKNNFAIIENESGNKYYKLEINKPLEMDNSNFKQLKITL
jgi:FkbH-like protein